MDFSQPQIVRPEFGPTTDIKTILRRHGGIPPATRQPIYTETDYSADLTTALRAVEQAHLAFDALTPEQKKRYRSPTELWERNKFQFQQHSESPDALPANSSTPSGTPTPASAITPPANP